MREIVIKFVVIRLESAKFEFIIFVIMNGCAAVVVSVEDVLYGFVRVNETQGLHVIGL